MKIMAEFKALNVSECADAFLGIEKPLIAMHKNPDGDTVGSCAAMCKIFRSLGKEPMYICADEIPLRLEFILQGEREAELTDVAGRDVIAVDVATPTQLGGLREAVPSFRLMIDHHEVGIPFADNFIIGGASSCAEVVLEIALELERRGLYSMEKGAAYALYAGISSDTGGFRYSSTTPETMRRAAALMEMGIDFSDINHKLFSTKTQGQIRVEGFVGSNLKTAFSGRVAYASITLEDAAALGAKREDMDTAVDVVRCAIGSEVAFIAKELPDGGFKISIRSTGTDVAAVAKVFGGGGHIRASGCTVAAGGADEAAELILAELKKIL